MKRFLGAYRLIPIVLLATGALFILKSTGLVLDGGYTLGERMASRGAPSMTVTIPASPSTALRTPSTPLPMAGAEPKQSWMQEMFNYPVLYPWVWETAEKRFLAAFANLNGRDYLCE